MQNKTNKGFVWGKEHGNFKGGWVGSNGYKYRRVPDKKTGEMKDVLVHRYRMEKHLGRELSSEEHVDHINGNKLDNRIENLRVCSKWENEKFYWGLTDKDYEIMRDRLLDGASYREAIEGTNIKSHATARNYAKKHGIR